MQEIYDLLKLSHNSESFKREDFPMKLMLIGCVFIVFNAFSMQDSKKEMSIKYGKKEIRIIRDENGRIDVNQSLEKIKNIKMPNNQKKQKKVRFSILTEKEQFAQNIANSYEIAQYECSIS